MRQMLPSMHRLWILSEVFYPEETGTGHYITGIAEYLAQTRNVAALCVQPSYSSAGERALPREKHGGVEIFRCGAILLRGRSLAARLLKMSSITLSLLMNALLRVRKGDSILAVTNPPTLPVMAAILSWARGIPYTLVVHDVYPEILAACGKTTTRSLTYRLMLRINRWALRRASRITTIGADMMEHLTAVRGTGSSEGITMIPLWSDLGDVNPDRKENNALLEEIGAADKMVVLYAGNMGFPHGIDTLAEVTRRLAGDKDIHFLFIGSGPKRRIIEELADSGAGNITILNPRARAEQNEFLNACDVSILSLESGMLGLAVPSRTYNIMAAGKPVIALVSSRSETAKVVLEEGIGWVIEPGDVAGATAAILEAKMNRALLREMGARARKAAEQKYTQDSILRQFDSLLADLT